MGSEHHQSVDSVRRVTRAVIAASTVMVAVALWFIVGLILGGLPGAILSVISFCVLTWWYAR